MEAKQTPTTSQGIPHNTRKWELRTNRHRSTDGTLWGWIEGAPGNVCWGSSGGAISHEKAAAAVKEHNEWLDAQASPELKSMRILEKMAPLEKEIEAIRRDLASKELKLQSLTEELSDIAKATGKPQ